MTLTSGIGLATGLNTNEIITALLSFSSRPIELLETKIYTYNAIQSALQQVNGQLTNLQASLQQLRNPSTFSGKTATISRSSILTASISSVASEGTYSILTQQMAQAERIAAQGFADTDDTGIAGASGSFSFKLGKNGTVKTVSVTSTMTLAEFRDAINNADGNVNASIVNDGTSTNPYRIVLTSSSTGATNEIFITQNDTNLNFSTTTIEDAVSDSSNAFDGTATASGTYTGTTTKNYVVEITTGGAVGVAQFKVSEDGGLTWSAVDAFTTSASATNIYSSSDEGTQIAFAAGTADFVVGDRFMIDAFAPKIQAAADAFVEVDGIQVRNDSNTFTEAIEGITFTLSQVDEDPVTITVQNDNATTRGLIASFIDAYNMLVDEINSQTAFDSDTNVPSPLFGDSTTRNISYMLSTTITSRVAGLTSGLTSLGAVGVNIDSGGKLSLDVEKINEVLDDPVKLEQLKAIFSVSGLSDTTKLSLVKAASQSNAGTFLIKITKAAEEARITGNQAITSAGITNNERLTFTYGDPDEEEDLPIVSVQLQTGDKLADIIEKINITMTEEGMSVRAYDDNGKLLLKTIGYGTLETFSVYSNQNGGVDTQTGIGTTAQTDTGINVAGTINGIFAKGSGQDLTGVTGTDVEGLTIKVTSDVTGTIGNITVSYGIAERLYNQLDSFINPTDGTLVSKQEGISNSIDGINDQIDRMQQRLEKEEARLRAQFVRMEVLVSQYQAQMSFLSSWIATLDRK